MGEGDRAERAVEGAGVERNGQNPPAPRALTIESRLSMKRRSEPAPSTMLRMVPLPRFAEEDPSLQPSAVRTRASAAGSMRPVRAPAQSAPRKPR